MLPVRTLGTVYTVRSETLVRMQLTRSIDGPGWNLRRGTEFYGVVRGSDYETGRAYVSLLGFIDKESNRLVRLSGNLLGGDGTEGLRGNKHRLGSRWSKALHVAGAGALDVFGTLAASLGRRPIIVSDVYGTANGRAVSPLLQELGRSSNDRRAGFVEVPASTPGYVLVLTMPRNAQGVDAQIDSLNSDELASLTGDDLQRLTAGAPSSSATLISDAELSELLTTGTPLDSRRAMPRMTPEMRRVAEQVLAQAEN